MGGWAWGSWPASCPSRIWPKPLIHACLLCSAGCVIKPGDVRCIPNEGMPVYRSPAQKGKLVIHFEVQRPPTAPSRALLGSLGGAFPHATLS